MNYPISITCSLITALVCASISAQEQKPITNNILYLDFAHTSKNLVAVGEQGTIILSEDNGANWITASTPIKPLLTSVFFINENVGWAVGHQSTVLKTINGGSKWEISKTNIKESALFDVYFSDPDHGVAIGAFGSFYRTRNGGKSWRKEKQMSGDKHLYKIRKIHNTHYAIIGEKGLMLRSNNLEEWHQVKLPTSNNLLNITSNGNDILIVGTRGTIIQSENAGKTWNNIPPVSIAALQAAATLSDEKILIGGSKGTLHILEAGQKKYSQIFFGKFETITSITQLPNSELVFTGKFGIRKSPVNMTYLTIENDE